MNLSALAALAAQRPVVAAAASLALGVALHVVTKKLLKPAKHHVKPSDVSANDKLKAHSDEFSKKVGFRTDDTPWDDQPCIRRLLKWSRESGLVSDTV